MMATNDTTNKCQLALVVISEANLYFAGTMSPCSGDTFYLLTDQPNIVGRKEDVTTICIKDGMVARQHCRIEWCSKTNTFELTDIGARNPTAVNDKTLNRNESVSLRPGDTIRCGRTVFRLLHSYATGEHSMNARNVIETNAVILKDERR